jgi:hypothetical protein
MLLIAFAGLLAFGIHRLVLARAPNLHWALRGLLIGAPFLCALPALHFSKLQIGVVLIGATAAALYRYIIHPLVLRHPEIEAHCACLGIDPGFYGKLRLLLKGWKTRLWGRFLIIVGPVLPALQALDVVDFSAMLPVLHPFGLEITPAVYMTGLVLPLLGKINNKLRAATDGPPGANTLLPPLPADPAE